jgi:hypothetical protein
VRGAGGGEGATVRRHRRLCCGRRSNSQDGAAVGGTRGKATDQGLNDTTENDGNTSFCSFFKTGQTILLGPF